MPHIINCKCERCKKDFGYIRSHNEYLPMIWLCSACIKAQRDEHERHHFIQLEEMTLLNRVRRIERILYSAKLTEV